MADTGTIANAYIRILPDMSGIQGELEGELGNAGESAGATAGGRFASALGVAAKAGIAATAAAGAAVGKLTKSAVDSYADYEQLIGGIETLYGASAGQMEEYAKNAFKTAGMSANEYMEIAIQSSAAMISSLGGDQAKAAEMTNMAMTDMSDNVNKMGTDMEAVQNAYRGFSRGNFTMLDNLALGFSGTKEGMQQLLDQATQISGIEYDISSYSDIVQAIHVVQEEMGIAGTTQAEAAETISGSLGMLKSSWENLVTGFADKDADMSQLVGNVVESAKTVATNLMPVIEQALVGIGDFIKEIGPVIVEELPGLMDSILPSLVEAIGALLEAVAETLPEMALKITVSLVGSLTENLPMIMEAGVQTIITLASGLGEALPELIPAMVDAILTMVETLLDNIPELIEAALQLMIGLATGLINAIPVIIERLPEIITAIFDALVESAPLIAEAGVKLLSMLVENLPTIISNIVAAVPQIVNAIAEGFLNLLGTMRNIGVNLISSLGDGLLDGLNWIADKVQSVSNWIIDKFNWLFAIGSPSKVFRDMGGFLMQGLAQGINDHDDVLGAMDALSDDMTKSFNSDLTLAATSGNIRMYKPSDALMRNDSTDMQSTRSGSRNLTVILELDRTQLGRAVYRLNREETQRVGVRLAGGGAV